MQENFAYQYQKKKLKIVHLPSPPPPLYTFIIYNTSHQKHYYRTKQATFTAQLYQNKFY